MLWISREVSAHFSCLIETKSCKGSVNTTISSAQSYCESLRITNLGKAKIRAFTLSGSHSKQFRIFRIWRVTVIFAIPGICHRTRSTSRWQKSDKMGGASPCGMSLHLWRVGLSQIRACHLWSFAWWRYEAPSSENSDFRKNIGKQCHCTIAAPSNVFDILAATD